MELTEFDARYREENAMLGGMDEVGRGPLAGPVVAACVSIPVNKLVPGVDDSKKLSEARREVLAPQLQAAAEYCRISAVEPARIDEINILEATREAMNTAAADFNGVLLVDALGGLSCPSRIVSVIHGDALSYMIGAASIVAKVWRDHLMLNYDELYPGYGFARNKGYGTAEHIDAIKRLGPCPIHRLSFIQKWL